MLGGLSAIFIELTSICDKKTLCAFCGHQKNPNIEYGTMNFNLLKNIAPQIPNDIVVSFHRSGEPTAYPYFRGALSLFFNNITSLVTHGMNLVKKADEIIDNCTTVTVSIHKGDSDTKEQIEILKQFMELKGNRRPQVQVKWVGYVGKCEEIKGVRFIRRDLHLPQGSYGYVKRPPTIPECGVCGDLLGKPSINWQGDVSVCNRFDPDKLGVIGNVTVESFDDIWNGEKRKQFLNAHMVGKRELMPFCRKCTFWGIPTSG